MHSRSDMLKTRQIELTGRDDDVKLTLQELPALAADRIARKLIDRWRGDKTGGVVGLALRHQAALRKLGEGSLPALMPFVNIVTGAPKGLDSLKDWQNVGRVQQAALALHADFLIGRESLELPIAMQAEGILAGEGLAATFCSPFIAAVIQSGMATYVELETILSTEDAFNLAELLNVDAVRHWRDAQKRKG